MPTVSLHPLPREMTQLDQALESLTRHDGVEHVVLVGVDGLLVHHLGVPGGVDPDRVAAMLPGLLRAADEFGRAADEGAAATVVLELEHGVAIAVPLSPDLLLAVLLRQGVAFPALLREVRRNRSQIAALV